MRVRALFLARSLSTEPLSKGVASKVSRMPVLLNAYIIRADARSVLYSDKHATHSGHQAPVIQGSSDTRDTRASLLPHRAPLPACHLPCPADLPTSLPPRRKVTGICKLSLHLVRPGDFNRTPRHGPQDNLTPHAALR